MAAGDDQKNIYLWKLSKNLHKFVRKILISEGLIENKGS
jgi:hypothetical protein